jgi:hypothetical protein
MDLTLLLVMRPAGYSLSEVRGSSVGLGDFTTDPDDNTWPQAMSLPCGHEMLQSLRSRLAVNCSQGVVSPSNCFKGVSKVP